MMNRAEHLAWAKQRALEYLDKNDTHNAFNSMLSDLQKHDELRKHIGIELGMAMLLGGHMHTTTEVRKWVEGFN